MEENRTTGKSLPSVFYNWISAVGAVLAVVSFSIIVLLILIDLYVKQTTIYLGLVTFMLLPTFLVTGLVLIAVGALVERRRQAFGIESAFPTEIYIDLRNLRHRNAVMIWTVGTGIFLLASSVGSYKLYKETESTEFCGQLCHSVMHPEFIAYQGSPHARVECVECHIGPGADWFVKSKLSGAYQVYATLADIYPRPVPTPITNLRPARETCEQCHWPEKFFEARKVVNPHFLSDEGNTPYPVTMLINIGGTSEHTGEAEGIHWHVSGVNKMEYIARDAARQDIAWVRMTHGPENQVVYADSEDPLSEEEIAKAEIRTMDCIDCHNRPAHIYDDPSRFINVAIAADEIPSSLPFIKKTAVEACMQEYESTADAMEGIREYLTTFYQENYNTDISQSRDLEKAIVGVQHAFSENIFPSMKVTWEHYPDNIGHMTSIGCDRCHDGKHTSADGRTISNECQICHTIMAQGPPENFVFANSAEGLAFRHPVDIDEAWLETGCFECHSTPPNDF